MFDRINLSIPLLSDVWIVCAYATLQVEFHNNAFIPSQKRLDLVYNDIKESFLFAVNGARYVVFFLDDDTKESEVNFRK